MSNCLACIHGEIRFLHSFGDFPNLNKPDFASNKTLDVYGCENCGVVQIPERFTRDELFPLDYAFRSKITESLRQNFKDLVELIQKLISPGAKILEIGCNDGYLLELLDSLGFDVCGVEPTDAYKDSNLIDKIFHGFFEDLDFNHKFDMVILTNTFAHLDSPIVALKKIEKLLNPNGLILIEVLNLECMLKRNEFDKFTTEHGFFFTSETLQNFMGINGFTQIFNQNIETHGGSIRSVFQSSHNSISHNVDVNKIFVAFKDMTSRIKKIKHDLDERISSLVEKNYKGVLVGATNRGILLLATLEIEIENFFCVLDHPQSKRIGTELPYVNLPIYSDDKMFQDELFGLILAWHVAPEIMSKMRAKGFTGPFIVPLPSPSIHWPEFTELNLEKNVK